MMNWYSLVSTNETASKTYFLNLTRAYTILYCVNVTARGMCTRSAWHHVGPTRATMGATVWRSGGPTLVSASTRGLTQVTTVK